MDVREFHATDVDGCLAVFDSNTPTYFKPHERTQYEQFLSNLPGTYLVVESDKGVIVGCGGYAQDSETTAVLTFGMVHAQHHRQSIGTHLLEERLGRIRRQLDVPKVVVNTTQLTEGFFARFGFQTKTVTPDQYAPGLDGVYMSLWLDESLD